MYKMRGAHKFLLFLTLKCLNLKRHFQQYFSYIMVISLMLEEAGVSGENHRPWASNW